MSLSSMLTEYLLRIRNVGSSNGFWGLSARLNTRFRHYEGMFGVIAGPSGNWQRLLSKVSTGRLHEITSVFVASRGQYIRRIYGNLALFLQDCRRVFSVTHFSMKNTELTLFCLSRKVSTQIGMGLDLYILTALRL